MIGFHQSAYSSQCAVGVAHSSCARDLGPQVVRQPDAPGLRERRRTQPAGDAADLHHVGHHVVGRVGVDRVLHVERSPPVLAALDRGFGLARDLRVARIVVRKRRLLDPRQTLAVEHAHPLHRVGGRQALVVIDHDRDAVAHRAAHRANDLDVLAHGRVADLRFHAGEAAPRPVLRDRRRTLRAVVADRAVGRDRLLDAAEKPHERRAVAARQRIPQRHVDRRQRDADETLRAEQPKAPRELVLDLGRGERLAFHQRLDIADELRDGRERRRRVGEHQSVSDDPSSNTDVGQHQRRFRDDAARRLMRLAHRDAHRAHAQFRELRGRTSVWLRRRSSSPPGMRSPPGPDVPHRGITATLTPPSATAYRDRARYALPTRTPRRPARDRRR